METVQQQEGLSITVEDLRSVLRNFPNWKVAGQGGFKVFGLQAFRTYMKE